MPRKVISPKPEADESPASTGDLQVLTRFKPGQSGNPAGRKRGSRNKLSQSFMDALDADFEQHGVDVIVKVRVEQPAVYFKVIAALMPAKLETSHTELSVFASYNMSDPQEFLEAYRLAKSMIGAAPPLEINNDD
jgi:hypothetical protein